MILFLMVIACRTSLFGKSQLQIGKDRLRIVNAWGAVTDEIHYGAIAAVKLVRKTAVAEPEGNPFEQFAGRGLLGRGWREIMREPQIAFAITQQHLLGIRFHDTENGKLDRHELAADKLLDEERHDPLDASVGRRRHRDPRRRHDRDTHGRNPTDSPNRSP